MAASILRIVEEEAARHGAQRVCRVVLRAGIFTGIEPHALIACFELLAEGSLAEGARLEVEREPAAAVCEDCGAQFALLQLRARCPVCGGDRLRCEGGRGCVVDRIDVDEPKAPSPASAGGVSPGSSTRKVS